MSRLPWTLWTRLSEPAGYLLTEYVYTRTLEPEPCIAVLPYPGLACTQPFAVALYIANQPQAATSRCVHVLNEAFLCYQVSILARVDASCNLGLQDHVSSGSRSDSVIRG